MTLASSKQTLPVPGAQTAGSRAPEQAPPPQKGWLHRWTRKQWCRHWFVLNGGSLTYYRKPEFEHYSFLDGVLDLSLISRIELAPEPAPASAAHTAYHHNAHHLQHHHHHNHHLHHHLNKHHHHHPQQQQQHQHHHQYQNQQQQYQQQQQQQQQASSHFAFSLRMWNGECHLLSAGSAAERALWLAAINECADNGCLEDDPATDSASSSDSSPTSNLSAKSIDAGEPLPQWRSTHRCDQLALDQLALSIKSAIRRRDQQNNHSLKFLSDLHGGSTLVGGKLAPNHDHTTNDDNNNSQQQDDAHQEKKPDQAPLDRGQRQPATRFISSLVAASPNEVQKKPTPQLSCWSPSQRASSQHQVDQASQEVVPGGGMQQQPQPQPQPQQKAAPRQEDNDIQPSFKKRPLLVADNVYSTNTDSPPSGKTEIPFLVPTSRLEDDEAEEEQEEEEEETTEKMDKKSPQPQKKRVTFDLSLSSLYQLTSSSGSEDSDDEHEDQDDEDDVSNQESNEDEADHDELSDSGEESSLSPSSSLSSQCMSDTEAEQSNITERLEEKPTVASPGRNSAQHPSVSQDYEHEHEHEPKCVPRPTTDGVSCKPEAAKDESFSSSLETGQVEPPSNTCRLANSPQQETEPCLQIQELRQQLEAAQQEVGNLQSRLSSSYANYGQLELTCERVRADLLACEESQKQELLRLQARVEELSKELAASQQELLEARRKLLKFKEQRTNPHQHTTTNPGPKDNRTAGGARYQSWLRLHQQVGGGSHQPLLLMHHVKHTIAANQQLLGAKLLNHSKQIQRKLNELELKVDRIQLGGLASELS